MAFNPQEHMTKLKGKDYLEVKWRLFWFKDKHSDNGAIATEILSFDPIVVKATVLVNGVIIATGHGSAKAAANAVWTGREIEKAETAAIGRALGHAGFGTQFDEDEDLTNIADSPVEKPKPADKPATPKGVQQPPPPKQNSAQETTVAKLTREQWAHLQAEYGSDLVRAGLKVEKGSDWQGTYEQAVNAILAVNVPF